MGVKTSGSYGFLFLIPNLGDKIFVAKFLPFLLSYNLLIASDHRDVFNGFGSNV